MELSLFEIWASMSLLSRLVAISLLGMGVASFAVIIERTWVLRRTDRESLEFASHSRSQFADGDIAELLSHRCTDLMCEWMREGFRDRAFQVNEMH